MGNILANLPREKDTPNQIIPDIEPTLEEKRESLRKSLGVSSLDNTFATFKPVKGTENALKACQVLASGKANWNMLMIYGPVGNGKTHLCEAVSIEMYKRGLFIGVLTMDTIMSVLKECMQPESRSSYEERLRHYCYAERLIIDDADGTDWGFGELEKIIRVRYKERLFTLMTTNRDITELPERITSRFSDPDAGRCVLNKGDDYRKLKAK